MVLDRIKYPSDLKKLTIKEKEELKEEIKEEILKVVSRNGGHLASNLGVVDLTIALYSILDLPRDKVIWDVGHQCYTHKILTGRKDKFNTLREMGGIAGFPRTRESIYDTFDVGHSSTSISLALGMARAKDINKTNEKIVAVIGDGALTSGLSIEALFDAGVSKTNLVIILNDNEMSISKNNGGISKFLAKLRTKKSYISLNSKTKLIINHIPIFGKYIYQFLSYIKKRIKGLFIHNMYFENIGFTYLGPVNGHSISDMEEIFKNSFNIPGPVLIHVITKKGKGYKYAEQTPNKYHSVSPFNLETGKPLKDKMLDYSSVFGKTLTNLAKKNEKIVAITAAMEEATGLSEFKKMYPNRFFNVEICEEHAITMAAGMAKAGLIPVVALYSSFLQRAYDELVHDVCLTKQHVIICVDRAGNTGEDGETHHGIYDLSYLNTIPNLTIMAPKNFNEFEDMIKFAINSSGPFAIRYPKGSEEFSLKTGNKIKLGKSEIIKEGKDITIIAIGKMVYKAIEVSNLLLKEGIEAEVINVRFLKPLDVDAIISSYKKTGLVVTMEDNDKQHGLGITIKGIIREDHVLNIGYNNIFLPHGNILKLEKKYHMDVLSIKKEIIKFINNKKTIN